MAQFPRPGPGSRPSASSGEFIAPSGGMRLRGSTHVPGAKPAPPPREDRPDDATAGSRSHPARRDELKLCGLAAVKARFARDPGSIQRLFFDHPTSQRVGVICKVLAQTKKVYRCVEPAELERIAGSVHHGGIVAVVAAPEPRTPAAADLARWAAAREPILVLDHIGNTHNLGAIARTAAFFGLPRLVLADHPDAARPSDSAYRVAEGGFEQLEVWQARDLTALLRDLAAAGYEVVGAATRGGRADTKPTPGKPLALVLGNEERGLAPEVAAVCTRLVTIPGRGGVESLNVSVAGAVLMWELFGRKK